MKQTSLPLPYFPKYLRLARSSDARDKATNQRSTTAFTVQKEYSRSVERITRFSNKVAEDSALRNKAQVNPLDVALDLGDMMGFLE